MEFRNDKTKSLEEQIKELRSQLKTEIYKLVQDASQPVMRALLAQFNITGEIAELRWDFVEEYNDEGGTYWCPENIELYVDGKEIDTEELSVKRKGRYSDQLWDYYLSEDLYDFINGIKDQLSDYAEDEKFEFKIGGQN